MKAQPPRPLISLTLSALGLLAGCGPTEPPVDPNVEDVASEGDDAGSAEDVSADADAGDAPDEDTGPDDDGCDPETVLTEFYGTHDTPAVATATFSTLDEGYEMVVDASLGGRTEAGMSSYVYIDLGTQAMVELSDVEARNDVEWDLAFNRSFIRINGADSGPGNLMLARLDGTTWEEAEPPPPGDAWREDEFLSEDCDLATFGFGWPETAFAQWYDYDPVHHTLSPPEDTVYYLYDSVTHQTTKLDIVGYDGGTYTIRWE